MKYVVLYESAEGFRPKALEHFAEHQAHFMQFADRGELLMIGPFSEPVGSGAMSVFTTREAAEQFVAGDPFVREGVVASYEIREWNEALTP